jgi:hypothetical protein
MRSQARRLLAIGALVAALLGAFAHIDHARGVAAESIAPVRAAQVSCASAAGQALHHAGLVIVFPEGRIETRCIEFAEDTISGIELLRRSGLPLVISGFGGLGGAVCRIDNVGCSDPSNCWCQCHGASCAYWTYYTMQGDAWRFQNIGPAQRQVRDGDADAWVWGSGHASPGAAAPPCPTPVPTAAPTSAPRLVAPDAATSTPSRPHSTPTPSRTPTPFATARPTDATPPLAVVAQETPPGATRPDATANGASGGGVPTGLIAFGIVAGILVAAGGGLAFWRRLRD